MKGLTRTQLEMILKDQYKKEDSLILEDDMNLLFTVYGDIYYRDPGQPFELCEENPFWHPYRKDRTPGIPIKNEEEE